LNYTPHATYYSHACRTDPTPSLCAVAVTSGCPGVTVSCSHQSHAIRTQRPTLGESPQLSATMCLLKLAPIAACRNRAFCWRPLAFLRFYLLSATSLHRCFLIHSTTKEIVKCWAPFWLVGTIVCRIRSLLDSWKWTYKSCAQSVAGGCSTCGKHNRDPKHKHDC
jgi:hypothetical protein